MIGALAVVLLGLGGGGWYFVLGPGKPGAPTPPPVVTTEPSDAGLPPDQPVPNEATEAPPPVEVTDTAPQVPAVEPPRQSVETPPPEPVDPEDMILEGFDVPSDVQAFRTSHIAGTLGGYIQAKSAFDDCQQKQPPCDRRAALMQNALAAQVGP